MSFSFLPLPAGGVPVPEIPDKRAPAVRLIDGRPMASSLDVAAFFGKNHRHVLRSIQRLRDNEIALSTELKNELSGKVVIELKNELSGEVATEPKNGLSGKAVTELKNELSEKSSQGGASVFDANFRPDVYQDSTGRTLPMFYMTEFGFWMLTLPFTGEFTASMARLVQLPRGLGFGGQNDHQTPPSSGGNPTPLTRVFSFHVFS